MFDKYCSIYLNIVAIAFVIINVACLERLREMFGQAVKDEVIISVT